MSTECKSGECQLGYLLEEVCRLQQWVKDLQSGMYINCAYCGHRYGPNDEVLESQAQILYRHISQCESHPLAVANKQVALLEKRLEDPKYLRFKLRKLEGKGTP